MERLTEQQLDDARSRWDIVANDVALKRRGREFVGLCAMHAERTPSFYVVPDKGYAYCFGCGWHGTVIDFVMQTRGLAFKDAVREILGLPPQRPRQEWAELRPRETALDQDAEREMRQILSECEPVTERTAAGIYCHMRGLTMRQPALFAHPGLECWELGRDQRGDVRKLPAVVAPIRNSDDEITAILRTWVLPRVVAGEGVKDNRAPLKTRKKSLGVMGDGAVRLQPAGPIFGLAEGWESAASAELAYSIPVWAASGTARFGFPAHWRERRPGAGVQPQLWFPPDRPPSDVDAIWLNERPPSIWVPPEVEQLIVFGDNGPTGRAVATFAADYWRRQGLDASVLFPAERFGDFNDAWVAHVDRIRR